MRLFVAIDIDSAIAQRLGSFEDELRRRIAAQAPRARITWVPVQRLHLTVRFIGEVDEDRAAAIGRVLEARLEAAPFELSIDHAGAFPERGRPRVLWAGISHGIQGLQTLEREVSARLYSCGLAREERPYRPHLTLARVRDGSGLHSPQLFEGIASREFGTMSVDAITLFLSRPSSRGSEYVPFQRTRLTGAGDAFEGS